MTFTVDLTKYAKKTKSEIGTAKRAIVFQVFANVIKMSPVDKGRFKGNWFITEDNPATYSRLTTDTSAAGNLGPESEKELALISEKFTIDILTNNLAYAGVLEFGGYPDPVKNGTRINKSGTRKNPITPIYEKRSNRGYSRQAPFGMVRITLRKFNRIAKKEGWS